MSQSGRVVYGAGFKFQSALQARVRIPPLTTHFKQVKIILPSSESSCNLPSTFCASTVRVPRLPPDSLTPCQIGVEPSRLLENGEGRIAQTCDPFLGKKRNEMSVHRGSCLLCIMLWRAFWLRLNINKTNISSLLEHCISHVLNVMIRKLKIDICVLFTIFRTLLKCRLDEIDLTNLDFLGKISISYLKCFSFWFEFHKIF